MLSKKLTFSLTSLVVLLAFGLAFHVPTAMADHGNFDMTLSIAENMIDVSSDDGTQIASGRTRANRALPADTSRFITLVLKSTQIIQLGAPVAQTDNTDDLEPFNGDLQTIDVQIDAYGREGRALGKLGVADVANIVTISHRDTSNPGKEFLIRIDESELVLAYTNAGGPYEIHTLLFTIAAGSVERADLGYLLKKRSKDGHATHTNNHVGTLRVDLVDNDEGDPEYVRGSNLNVASTNDGTPGVVAIQTLKERVGFIETGPFTVRVILTEEPTGGFKADHVAVMGGSATAVSKGTTLKGGLPTIAEDLTATPQVIGQDQRNSELTPAMVNYYYQGTDENGAPIPVMVTAGTAAGTDGTYGDNFPEPTGRDNQFHQYFVTVTPNAGYNGDVRVSIKQFDDKVLPEPNTYVPLTDAQIAATTLVTTGTPAPRTTRDSRVLNETLTVQVNSAADPKVAAAKAAYEKRSKDPTGIFNKNPNLKALGKGSVIPAGGYLVLASGKTDSDPISGVQNVDAKITKKLTAAQKAYNVVYDFKLPFPANDLSTFFRNGGTLQLIHADIPEATDSGHGDSKASKDGDTTHKDYTGYVGATTKQYAAGDVIINEIMWGLDGESTNSQYIELHNTTAADIGIDHLEWAIAVGSGAALGGTVLDTVNNNPSTGYWTAPGGSGVTKASAENPTVSSLVSMSRVKDATDGSAAASWTASQPVGSVNLIGARIGTPGAANSYVAAPAPPPPTPPAPPAKAPAAVSGDVMISEIMVASNGGRLPQWIELANVSAGDVSLMGWTAVINNDPNDAAVVGSAINLDLGDVVIGKDQVALVVSKAGRSSGEGTAKGDLRSDRIIDVQAQVSPGAARYMLLSETATKITLVAPPATGGVIVNADVVGNLGMGWELPMAEGNRSSLIRREMGKTAEIMGTDEAGWSLASDTMMDGAYRETYYGQASDVGTPGYDAGGPLPVELSKFGAKRDPLTGQVIVTWETQSELNNAGFYIKRSQQKNSKFVAVNPTMIAGAGTTSEKQSYTYTDTTAQPNIVYYYQIEDVSLDGQRQTLTRAHRLKGHIGAAGKATTTWGELKSSRE